MKDYKTNAVKMGSDIAMLSLRYCGKGGVEFKNIHFGFDGCYNVYFNKNLDEIPCHYLESQNQGIIDEIHWLDVISDNDIRRYSASGKLNWYLKGHSLLINVVK